MELPLVTILSFKSSKTISNSPVRNFEISDPGDAEVLVVPGSHPDEDAGTLAAGVLADRLARGQRGSGQTRSHQVNLKLKKIRTCLRTIRVSVQPYLVLLAALIV